MKILSFILFLFISDGDGITKIAEVNRYKKEAAKAYLDSDYQTSADKYKYLVDSLEIKEDPVILNLANSYYHLDDTTSAMKYYGSLIESKSPDIKSKAYQQLGVIEFKTNNYNLALSHLKNSLKANPENENARYNYELLKRMMQQNPDMNKDQNKQDDIEPSEYAKKLKEMADQMVHNNQFVEAYYLMNEGLQKDETVKAYQEFIQKLSDVAEIEFNNQK